MVKIRASQYFDVAAYEKRIKRNRLRWARFLRGEPVIPAFMNLCAPYLCDAQKMDFKSYYQDLPTMAHVQLTAIAWRLENLDEDDLPEAVFLDQATLHEAVAFDLPIQYPENAPPWGGRLWQSADDLPDRFEPGLSRANRALCATQEKLMALRGMVAGLPVFTSVHLHAPFTMAAQLLGAQELFLLCADDPVKARALIQFCADFFVHFERMKWQFGIDPDPLDEFVCWREADKGFSRIWVSDDTSPMASPAIYRDFIRPANQALFSRFQRLHLHMDGCWDHLIPQVASFSPYWIEVGGETDWATAAQAMGSRTILQGGISGGDAHGRKPGECAEISLQSLRAAQGRAKAVLTVANEVHPGTPVENMQAIISAAREFERRAL